VNVTGRIRDEDLEEVRRRASIVDVASDYMQVRRAGRLFKAICPFHQEKTPSLSIDPIKNLYHCFGCGKGGDAISLVRELEQLSFPEAVERLARRFGVQLRYEQMSNADRAALKRRFRLVEAHRAAVEHFTATLLGAKEAEAARAYLKQRGFTRATAERFSVGFSFDAWDALCKTLRARGFSEDEIVDAGLASRRDSGGIIDRFRGRVMFPVFDVTGDPVAFGARRMGEGDGPKYINSSESPIYKKSQVLYALNWAKGDVVKAGRAMMVEGYTDVIALHEAGITEVVATCGTALGLEHLRTLQRFTQDLVLSLDADEAGGAAAERTYEQLIADAQQMGLSLKVVLMQRGEDPADSVARLGAEGFRALVGEAVPILEFVLRRHAARYNVGDPDTQARALADGLQQIAKTEKQSIRDEAVRKFSDWIRVDPNIVHVELGNLMRTRVAPKVSGQSLMRRSSAQVRLEKHALQFAIQFPELVKPHVDDTGPEYFSVPAHRALWDALAAGDDPETVRDDDARRAYTELAVEPIAGDANEDVVSDVFRRLKGSVLSRHIDEVKARLQAINPLDDRDGHDALFTELVELERKKRALTEEQR
jgi:DNA primase